MNWMLLRGNFNSETRNMNYKTRMWSGNQVWRSPCLLSSLFSMAAVLQEVAFWVRRITAGASLEGSRTPLDWSQKCPETSSNHDFCQMWPCLKTLTRDRRCPDTQYSFRCFLWFEFVSLHSSHLVFTRSSFQASKQFHSISSLSLII